MVRHTPNTLLVAFLAGTLALLGLTGCAHSNQAAEEANSDADEIAIGYGTLPKADSPLSVSSLDEKDVDRPVSRIEEMIDGRMAGVRVVRTPAGGFKVEIRGTTTLFGNTEPLYVVDGMPVSVDPHMGLAFLNAADVESIDVLKGPAASIYGVRGSNGVVIITTKR